MSARTEPAAASHRRICAIERELGEARRELASNSAKLDLVLEHQKRREGAHNDDVKAVHGRINEVRREIEKISGRQKWAWGFAAGLGAAVGSTVAGLRDFFGGAGAGPHP